MKPYHVDHKTLTSNWLMFVILIDFLIFQMIALYKDPQGKFALKSVGIGGASHLDDTNQAKRSTLMNDNNLSVGDCRPCYTTLNRVSPVPTDHDRPKENGNT